MKVKGTTLLALWHAIQCHSFIIPNNPKIKTSLSSLNDVAEELKRKAEVLKAEIKSFEDAKTEALTKVQLEKQAIAKEKLELSLRYSAEVPILKGDGQEVMERVYFKSMFGGNSEIVVYQASLPLGMILSEHENIPGAIEVSEVGEGSNASAVGITEGSLLRAVTACQMTMEQPTWQVVMGGIGRPKTTRMMYSTDYRPFEEVMDAVSSNRMDAMQRDVWIVLEVKK